MNINQNYIDKIFNQLIDQPIYRVDKLKDCKPKETPGLYLIYCELIYAHKYLKFGKGEDLKKRINNHLKGKKSNSVYNRKLSRDEKIKTLLPVELEFEEHDNDLSIKNRILFTETYCSFQYLELSKDIVSDCKRIFFDTKLYNEWCKRWNKKRRDENYSGRDDKTIIVEYPIEQKIKNEVRYIGRQPKLWLGWNSMDL